MTYNFIENMKLKLNSKGHCILVEIKVATVNTKSTFTILPYGSFIFAFIFLYVLNLFNPLSTLKSEYTDNAFQELVGF